MSKHQKHTKLKLRDNDNFAPNEIAIVGTKCSVIADLVQQVSNFCYNFLIAAILQKQPEVIIYPFGEKYRSRISILIREGCQAACLVCYNPVQGGTRYK